VVKSCNASAMYNEGESGREELYHTSYLLISSISSSIWCSTPGGAGPPSPCSAFETAKDRRRDSCARDAGRDAEEVREFIAEAAGTLLLYRRLRS
jgi:hypothetical protein